VYATGNESNRLAPQKKESDQQKWEGHEFTRAAMPLKMRPRFSA